MQLEELFEKCDLCLVTEERKIDFDLFDCGDSEDEQDLNDFFSTDAPIYQKKLLGKTYAFFLRSNPRKIVTAFTVSNDSIRLTNKMRESDKDRFLEDAELRDKTIKRFPGVLLGRLGTNREFSGKGYGSAVMEFIKSFFLNSNKTGCRFIIVDALNNENTLRYYKRNGFQFLIEDERLEAKYIGIGVGRLPLNTRLMYFDLLKLNSQTT